MDEWGFLDSRRYLIHDRDTKYTDSFRAIVKSGHVEPLKFPARSPNLNAYAERWVKSVKEEALSKLILFGEASLRRVLSEYLVHFHVERNHQGKDNVLLFPKATRAMDRVDGSVGEFTLVFITSATAYERITPERLTHKITLKFIFMLLRPF